MGLLGMFQKIFGHLGAGDSEESPVFSTLSTH